MAEAPTPTLREQIAARLYERDNGTRPTYGPWNRLSSSMQSSWLREADDWLALLAPLVEQARGEERERLKETREMLFRAMTAEDPDEWIADAIALQERLDAEVGALTPPAVGREAPTTGDAT